MHTLDSTSRSQTTTKTTLDTCEREDDACDVLMDFLWFGAVCVHEFSQHFVNWIVDSILSAFAKACGHLPYTPVSA